jgi:hypothetical protein
VLCTPPVELVTEPLWLLEVPVEAVVELLPDVAPVAPVEFAMPPLDSVPLLPDASPKSALLQHPTRVRAEATPKTIEILVLMSWKTQVRCGG